MPCDFDTTRADENLRVKKPIAATRLFSKRLEYSPFIDYAAHHWGDHAWGEAMEWTLERELLAFLNAPKALASIVQAQYRDARSIP